LICILPLATLSALVVHAQTTTVIGFPELLDIVTLDPITIPSNECTHGILYRYDDETLTVNGIYEGNLVEKLIDDVEFFGDTTIITFNDEVVTEGLIQEGMIISIFHDGELYNSYTVDELLTPRPLPYPTGNSTMATTNNTTNSSIFILPIDDININLSVDFGGNFKRGVNFSVPTWHDNYHRGVDISGNVKDVSINGLPIRAMADGIVAFSQVFDPKADWDTNPKQTWGHCIKIDHTGDASDFTTLYAHMNAAPTLAVGDTVLKGDIIGYVGNTGYSFGAHLHLEVTVNGALVDPMPYLENAQTYSPLSGWQIIDGNTYYYENGQPRTGWMASASGVTGYYFFEDGKMATGLTQIGNCKYYFWPNGLSDGTKGQLITGWVIIENKTRYFYPTGNIDGTRGQMITGWAYISTQSNGRQQYYLDLETGALTKGWKVINGNTYYFEDGTVSPANSTSTKAGQMKTGWKASASGVTGYYFYSSGKMAVGFSEVNGNWYYFWPSGLSDGTKGQITTGWRVVNSYSRYFSDEGNIDGTFGKMAVGWTSIDTQTNGTHMYYFESDGTLCKGWKVLNGYTRYFETGNVSPANSTSTKVGQLVLGWKYIELSATNAGTYYFQATNSNNTNGRMLKGTQTINGVTYEFHDGNVSPAVNSSTKTGQLIE